MRIITITAQKLFFCLSCLSKPRRRHRTSFDQVSEFDRGRIVACRDCRLFFREIDQRVFETKQLCDADLSSLDAEANDGLMGTHRVAPLPEMTGGLCA
ncbi:hypothetical protein TNCV_2971501 [Trichonephila clavipes]|nr:hypothetical protein TNCV_2971501 [Trichonephila clavipes]